MGTAKEQAEGGEHSTLRELSGQAGEGSRMREKPGRVSLKSSLS